MKSLLFSLLIVGVSLAIYSCGSDAPPPAPPCRCDAGCLDLQVGTRYGGFQKCGVACCGCFKPAITNPPSAVALRDFCYAHFGYDAGIGPDNASTTAYCLNTPTSAPYTQYPTCYNACTLNCMYQGYDAFQQLIFDQACNYQAALCVHGSPGAQVIPQ